MGLDMYLTRKVYVRSWDDEDSYEVLVTKNGQPTSINPKRISYVVEEIGYWRKANAIHKWFVERVQNGNDDCGRYPVSEEQLTLLIEYCQSALKYPEEAKKLLPTTDGFFFGSTEYDEGYHQDLEDTIKICREAIALAEEDRCTIYYQSSW